MLYATPLTIKREEFDMSARKLAKEAGKKLGVKDLSSLIDLDDKHLRKIIQKKNKRGGSVSRKKGGKIMQGYKAGGKV